MRLNTTEAQFLSAILKTRYRWYHKDKWSTNGKIDFTHVPSFTLRTISPLNVLFDGISILCAWAISYSPRATCMLTRCKCSSLHSVYGPRVFESYSSFSKQGPFDHPKQITTLQQFNTSPEARNLKKAREACTPMPSTCTDTESLYSLLSCAPC